MPQGAALGPYLFHTHIEFDCPLTIVARQRSLDGRLHVALQGRQSGVEHPAGHRRSRVRHAVDVVLVVVVQLVGELVHDVAEDHRVEVLAEDVQQVPVAHLAAAHDGVHVVAAHEAEAHAHHVHAHARREDDDDAVQQREEGQRAEDHEPEPEEHVDLLVDHVEGQDAERVVPLHLARRPELVEQRALHHPGKGEAQYEYTNMYNEIDKWLVAEVASSC